MYNRKDMKEIIWYGVVVVGVLWLSPEFRKNHQYT